MSRITAILANAAFYYILTKPSADCTGNFFIDEDVMVKEGITVLSHCSVVPGANLNRDLFVE
jgi:citronellol/citronellal dehydrogenase